MTRRNSHRIYSAKSSLKIHQLVYSRSLRRCHNSGMAIWAFTCKHCQRVFTYSEIGETLADFIAEEKPKLPPEGLECICPHCKVKSTYRRYELVYQKSASGRS